MLHKKSTKLFAADGFLRLGDCTLYKHGLFYYYVVRKKVYKQRRDQT